MMIKAQNLIKNFGQPPIVTEVLRGINLAIARGEFVAIIGPSGAGKSTLLYQLSLLDRPTSGEIYFDDQPTSELSQAEQAAIRLNELGYVFQDYALLPELTALENVALPLVMQGLSKAAAYGKSRQSLERIGLGHRLGNLPTQLSGGEQQRVSIARAIAHRPHILFADEPTANLDTDNGHNVMAAFKDLHREKQTIVMVTHEDEYAAYAERIISIKDGIVISDEKTKNH